jgi:chemotaxis protein methyltransferase CheR
MGIGALEFEYLRNFLRSGAAIVLDADKEYLAESRLMPLLNSEGFASVHDLLQQMRLRPSGNLHARVLDAMTNNETWFFRDASPFEILEKCILPELVRTRATCRKLAIWSAACSSGQEVYSIAMLLRERFRDLLAWDLRLLATDISRAVLQRAERGRYGQMEVNRGLPAQMLGKYFEREGLEWLLSNDIRRMATFKHMNLAEPWPDLGLMDVIMLRNVLIYFDVGTKRQILERISRVLSPDGYLFLGCAETTLNLTDSFERVEFPNGSCYRLRRRMQ